METKTNVFIPVMLVALDLAFIGYFLSLYMGNAGNTSTYTNLILIFTCTNSAFYMKEKMENKLMDIWVKLNAALLIIWISVVVVQLFV